MPGEELHAVHLPQEIFLKIFSSLKSDRSTLKSCGLVNKAWCQASRIYLFHSVDLSAILGQNDWLSFFLNFPCTISDLIRHIAIKNMQWDRLFTSTSTRILSHFATSLSFLTLSNIFMADFADLASVISKFKQLRTLSLKHVYWDTNSVDYNQQVPPHHTFPASVETLHLYHLDLGRVLGWLLAHAQPPTPPNLYLGPVEHRWKRQICPYFVRTIPSLSEFGIIFPDSSTVLEPYSLCSNNTWEEEIGTIGTKEPLPQELCEIADRFQARHGFSIHTTCRGLIGGCQRIVRLHRFLCHHLDTQGQVAHSVRFARILLFLEGFEGTLLLDVDVPNIRALFALNTDWEFLEDILSTETHRNINPVVFLAVTSISLSALESLISEKMPKAYGRGLLRFERGDDPCKL